MPYIKISLGKLLFKLKTYASKKLKQDVVAMHQYKLSKHALAVIMLATEPWVIV